MSTPSVPNLFNHLVVVYDSLEKESSTTRYAGQEIKIWEGALVSKISDILGFSTPYYSKVTVPLKQMGCIKQLRRGGGTVMSVWQLIKKPTIEEFDELSSGKIRDVRKSTTKIDAFSARLDAINLRLIAVEQLMQSIINEQIDSGRTDPLLESFMNKQESVDEEDE